MGNPTVIEITRPSATTIDVSVAGYLSSASVAQLQAVLAALANGGSVPTVQITQETTGVIKMCAGKTAPYGYFFLDGSTKSRTAYPDLYNYLMPRLYGVTITNATPAVCTYTAHGLTSYEPIILQPSVSLPTGLAAETIYYAHVINANTFHLCTSKANVYSQTFISTSSDGSGIHSLRSCCYGNGDGSTTYTLPDCSMLCVRGSDPTGVFFVPGNTGGAGTVTLEDDNLPSFSVASTSISQKVSEGGNQLLYGLSGSAPGVYGIVPAQLGTSQLGAQTWEVETTSSAHSHSYTGAATPFSILPPFIEFPYIIKY